jgi:hypothetical protein
MLNAPNETPWLSASSVAPRPTAAAIAIDMSMPRMKRTAVPAG